MFKKFLFPIVVGLSILTMSVQAKDYGVTEIENLTNPVSTVVDNNTVLQSDSYAYKSLKYLYSKYGGVMDLPQDKFKGTAPLTRNEAALILVNIMGKVERDNVQMSELEKEKMDALSDQLKQELGVLTARISNVETSVDSLQGTVSKIEESIDKKWGVDFGKNNKIGLAFGSTYSSIMKEGDNQQKFDLTLLNVYFQGKLAEHIDYFLLLDPGYEKYLGYGKNLSERAYISTDIIPHHKIKFGKQPIPIVREATQFYASLESGDFSQISRASGLKREMGLNIAGDFKYFDYQAGLFNEDGYGRSDTNSRGLNDIAFNGLITVKPFANHPQLGKLDIGSSYYTAKNSATHVATTAAFAGDSRALTTYNLIYPGKTSDMYSAYLRYKYHKFELKSEWLQASNRFVSNGTSTMFSNISGYYIEGLYFITPKIQLITKFDQYDKGLGRRGIYQYSTGFNYYFKYPNLSVGAIYTFTTDPFTRNSNKFLVGARFSSF